MEDAVKAHAERLQSLVAIGQGVVERLELRELLPLITRSVNRSWARATAAVPARRRPAEGGGAGRAGRRRWCRRSKACASGQSLSGWIISQGRPLAITDMLRDPRLLFGPMVERFLYRSFLGVPLRRGGEILGTPRGRDQGGTPFLARTSRR